MTVMPLLQQPSASPPSVPQVGSAINPVESRSASSDANVVEPAESDSANLADSGRANLDANIVNTAESRSASSDANVASTNFDANAVERQRSRGGRDLAVV